ncbi:hypothetical protein EJB05_51807, partial [Eragrostis curvula]
MKIGPYMYRHPGQEINYDDFFPSMLWPALPLECQRKELLMKTFRIQGIPSLVAIGPDGKTLTKHVKTQLVIYGGVKACPFTDDRLEELENKMDEMAKWWPKKLKHELCRPVLLTAVTYCT